LRKKDKILISFYAFLGISLILSLSYIDSTFGCDDFYLEWECADPEHDPEERPFIHFGGTKLNEIKTESTFNVDKEIIFDVMANVGNYNTILPQNVLSVKIIEEETNLIIAEHVLIERGIKVTVLAKHTLTPYNEHVIEILDGDAKGTKIIQTFIEDEGLTKISTDVELKLKGMLKPLYFLPKNNFAHAIGSVNTNFVEYTEMFNSPNVKIIDDIYRDLLLRPVDHESLEYWLPQLKSGLINTDDIRNVLLNSKEKKMADLHYLSTDEKIMRISDKNKTIIENLYLDLLNRPVDKDGLAYWGLLLENELSTEKGIKEQLYNSLEAVSVRKWLAIDLDTFGYEKMITDAFIDLIDREPTQEELEYYTEFYKNLDGVGGIEKRKLVNEFYDEVLAKADTGCNEASDIPCETVVNP
jgi:hypothetical protein